MSTIRERIRVRRSVSSTVQLGDNFLIGKGSRLWAPRLLVVGEDVSVGSGVRVEVDGSIGDGVLIANGAAIVGRADHDLQQIGVTIRRSNWVGDQPDKLSQPTHIGSDVWIGFGAIILSGVRIGDSSIIGAGSIVTHDVAPNTIVVGTPAQFVRLRFSPGEYEEHWRVLRTKGIRATSPEIE